MPAVARNRMVHITPMAMKVRCHHERSRGTSTVCVSPRSRSISRSRSCSSMRRLSAWQSTVRGGRAVGVRLHAEAGGDAVAVPGLQQPHQHVVGAVAQEEGAHGGRVGPHDDGGVTQGFRHPFGLLHRRGQLLGRPARCQQQGKQEVKCRFRSFHSFRFQN